MLRARNRQITTLSTPADHFIWSSSAPQSYRPSVKPRSTSDFLAEKQQYIHQIRRPVHLSQIHFSSAPLSLTSRRFTQTQPKALQYYWTERETITEPLTKRVAAKLRGTVGKGVKRDNMAVERLSIENGRPVVLLRKQHFSMLLRRLQGRNTASNESWKGLKRPKEETQQLRKSIGLAKGRISIDPSPSLPIFPLIAVKIAHF